MDVGSITGILSRSRPLPFVQCRFVARLSLPRDVTSFLILLLNYRNRPKPQSATRFRRAPLRRSPAGTEH